MFSLAGQTKLEGNERLCFGAEVWEMYVSSYQKVGLQYGNLNSFLSDSSLWYVAWDENGQLISFLAYKETFFGFKGVAMGSNNTRQGRLSAKELLNTLKHSAHFAELSHSPASIGFKLNLPIITPEKVKHILDKIIIPLPDQFYLRFVTNLGMCRKIMMGNPNLF